MSRVLLHGGGGDLEVLEDEGQDEEADGEDGADGGEGLERGFFAGLCGWSDLLFGGLVHRLLQGRSGSVQMLTARSASVRYRTTRNMRSQRAKLAASSALKLYRVRVYHPAAVHRCRSAAAQGEVDDEGSADNVLHGNETPVAAVAAVVAIVAEDEVASPGGR